MYLEFTVDNPADDDQVAREYDSILDMHSPIMFFYHAPWCSACKAMEPMIFEIANKEYKESLCVVGIDSDKYPALSACYKVLSLPTIVLWKDEEERYRIVGAITKYELEKRIEELLP
jgi:thioredoxin 1